MKKLLLSSALVVMGILANAQASLVPSIKNEKASFSITEKTSTTHFQLTAAEADIEALKTKAATLSTIKFSAVKLKGGNYDCHLIIMGKTEALYVQRIFGFLGFLNFTLDGSEKKLDQLGTSLSNLK